jgi:hypothetical protein
MEPARSWEGEKLSGKTGGGWGNGVDGCMADKRWTRGDATQSKEATVEGREQRLGFKERGWTAEKN